MLHPFSYSYREDVCFDNNLKDFFIEIAKAYVETKE